MEGQACLTLAIYELESFEINHNKTCFYSDTVKSGTAASAGFMGVYKHGDKTNTSTLILGTRDD